MSVVEQPTPVATADTAATRAELVARAVALRPLLREHAAAAEDNRRLSDEVNDVSSGRPWPPRWRVGCG
jgi:hypothetical protein